MLLDFIYENMYSVVDFAAESWCIPCRQFKPHFEAAAGKLPGIAFAHVDVDITGITDYFSIQGVPTVLWFIGDPDELNYMSARTAPALIREIQLLTSPAGVV